MWKLIFFVIFLAATGSAQECATTGLQCSLDCSRVIFCPSINNTGVTVKSCGGTGLFCGPSGGTFDCTTASCSGGSTVPIICPDGSLNLLPDPYNPKISYLCTSPGGNPVQTCTCPTSQCFSTGEQGCVNITQAPPCNRFAPLCSNNTVGRGFGYEDDLRYFYTCDSNLIAHIGMCSKGEVFFNTDQRCEPLTNSLVSKSGSTAPMKILETYQTRKVDPFPFSLGTCQNYVAPNSTDPPQPTRINCTYAGQKFPGPQCNNYYRCDSSLFPVLVTCPQGYGYDSRRQGCVQGFCGSRDIPFGTKKKSLNFQENYFTVLETDVDRKTILKFMKTHIDNNDIRRHKAEGRDKDEEDNNDSMLQL